MRKVRLMKLLTEEMQGMSVIQAFDSVLQRIEKMSFLRMGDGELRFLLESQDGSRLDDDYPINSQPSLNGVVKGAAANRTLDYKRVLKAYESCDFLDLHLHLPFVRDHLKLLKWNRRKDGWHSEDAHDSRILPRWFFNHFHDYVAEHKCLFCAGESPLQEALLQDPVYRQRAMKIWPETYKADFLPLPNFGRNLSRDYDEMRQSIASAIQENNYDTMFIGASGLAKPLCVEISNRYSVKALDIGSILRAMTYSATAGDATWPANHNPYYFSVPLSVYMKATRKAYPHLKPYELIAKANAQLCFDLMHGESGKSYRTSATKSLPANDKNIIEFKENYRYYVKELVPEFKGNEKVETQVLDLHWWLKFKGFSYLVPLPYQIKLLADRVKKINK